MLGLSRNARFLALLSIFLAAGIRDAPSPSSLTQDNNAVTGVIFGFAAAAATEDREPLIEEEDERHRRHHRGFRSSVGVKLSSEKFLGSQEPDLAQGASIEALDADAPYSASHPYSSLSYYLVDETSGQKLQDRNLQITNSDSSTTVGKPRPYGLSLCTDEHNRNWCSNGCSSQFYKVPGTGDLMTASTTCGGANWNTRIIVREGDPTEPCSAHRCVGSVDDRAFPGCEAKQSSVTWASFADKTYHIQVTGSSSELADTGAFTLTVTGTNAGLIESDAPECVAVPSASLRGDTTVDAIVPKANHPCPDEFGSSTCVNSCASLFYRVEGTGRRMLATTCDPATDLDTKIMVYPASDCDTSRLTCVARNNHGCGEGNLGSTVSWESVSGVIYFIQVTGAFAAQSGPFKLRVDGVKNSANLKQVKLCRQGKYVAHDPAPGGGTREREIRNNQKICLGSPYNIQVIPECARPLLIDPNEKVELQRERKIFREQRDSSEPIVLCGNANRDNTGLACQGRLPNGLYFLKSTTAGQIRFVQDC